MTKKYPYKNLKGDIVFDEYPVKINIGCVQISGTIKIRDETNGYGWDFEGFDLNHKVEYTIETVSDSSSVDAAKEQVRQYGFKNR